MSAFNVNAFRDAAPYIHAHRGRRFVIAFQGEALDEGAFGRLIEDIALLHALGVRLVLVFGAEPQIDAALAARGLEARWHEGRRVLDEAALAAVVEVLGRLRSDIEAGLSRSLVNTPMAGARLRVVSGNFVSARPLGVLDGVDLGHTGCVRRIERDTLGALLDAGHIVLLPPLGCSATGERFALTAEELAAAAAVSLQADKLIALLEEPVEPPQRNGRPLRELGIKDALALAERGGDGPWPARLRWAAQAARQGVGRVHLVDRRADGALLQELYTRDGAGLLVTAGGYEGLRRATLADVGGILRLIAPLEAEGVLVRRSREQLELEIDNFLVIERDGMVIACAALYPYAEAGVGELACLVVHPDYRGAGRGEALLRVVEERARDRGLQRLVVLTTRTLHWFIEHGFSPADPDVLPETKRRLYNWRRNSKVLVKTL